MVAARRSRPVIECEEGRLVTKRLASTFFSPRPATRRIEPLGARIESALNHSFQDRSFGGSSSLVEFG